MKSAAASLNPSVGIMQRIFLYSVHPWEPTLMFGALGGGVIWLSLAQEARSWSSALLLIVLGIFSWTFLEYLLHRFVFHLVREPWRTKVSGRHLDHHRDTEIKELILAPALVSLIVSGLVFLIFWGLSGNTNIALLLLGGLYLGYVAYEWCHYATHQYALNFPLGRYLKRYHLLHHFKNPNGTFGVTSPFWDIVFRTTYRPKRG
ncbi:MAG TPA: hypothetical protein DF383_05815 [Deltaproteobacteria bacterium]|nr:hypothetical protein [Deltaproteobacteria bacterium]